MKCWKRHIDTDDNGIPIAFKPIDNVGGIDAAFVGLVHRQMQWPIGREGYATGIAPLAHQLLGQKTGRTLWLFEHPRQPYESWWSIHLGIFRWLEVRFFNAPVPSG